jgi:integrase
MLEHFTGDSTGGPAHGIEVLPKRHPSPRPISDTDFLRFVAAARELGGEHEVIALMFALTGARFAEVRFARWSQFDLGGTQPRWHVQGKGSQRRGPKVRVVPLHPELVAVLDLWRVRAESERVLPGGARDGGIGEKSMRDAFRDVCTHAGLFPFVPHQMRHTVATLSLARSLDLRGVQELLGHASPETTQIYTQVAGTRLVSLVEGLLPGPSPRPDIRMAQEPPGNASPATGEARLAPSEELDR